MVNTKIGKFDLDKSDMRVRADKYGQQKNIDLWWIYSMSSYASRFQLDLDREVVADFQGLCVYETENEGISGKNEQLQCAFIVVFQSEFQYVKLHSATEYYASSPQDQMNKKSTS